MTGAVAKAVAGYIRRGFRVVPLFGVDPNTRACRCGNPECKPRDAGKHEPLASEGAWKDGTWFEPEHFTEQMNVALAMGPWKGGLWLVALDQDGSHEPDQLLELPETMTATSPRGRHQIYTVPAFTPLGNWVDIFSTKSSGVTLDLRYARGRIVVAPSIGSTGEYRWLDDRDPEPLPDFAVRGILAERRMRGLPVLDRWTRGEKKP